MLEFPFAMSRLLAPISVDEFFAEYYGHKPLVISRGHPDYYAEIISLDTLDGFLAALRPTREHLQVVDARRELGDEDYLIAGTQFVDLVKMHRLFAEGATISFRNMHNYVDGLTQVCRNAEWHFSCPVKANIYFSPPDAQGFRVHHDTHDVLVLQIFGSKKWRTFAPVIEAPLPGQGVYWEEGTPGLPLREFTLHAGDFLYCPKGIPHDAQSTTDASLHVTLGALSKSWAELLLECIADVALRDPALRANLPPRYATAGVDPAELMTTFRKLLKRVELQAQPKKVLSDFADELIFESRQILSDQRLQIGLLSKLNLASTMGARPGTISRFVTERGKFKVLFYHSEIEFPASVQPAILFALKNTRFRVDEVPGEFSAQEKLMLMRRLVLEGLVICLEA